jgi:hypothetical protein
VVTKSLMGDPAGALGAHAVGGSSSAMVVRSRVLQKVGGIPEVEKLVTLKIAEWEDGRGGLPGLAG